MELELKNLEQCFKEAIKQNRKYVGVKIKLKDCEEDEVIINPNINLNKKLNYYKHAYNEDLTLKACNEIKISGFTFGDTYQSIEEDLIGTSDSQNMNIKVKVDIDKDSIDDIVAEVMGVLNERIANKVRLSIR